jgi:NADH:ubiquinone oxidoreductase subunit E
MKIQVCTGKACREKFSNYILKRLENDKENFKLDHLIVETCTCQKKCDEAPVVVIDGKIEVKMTGIKASKLIMEKIKWKQKRLWAEAKKEFHREDSESDLENMYIGK